MDDLDTWSPLLTIGALFALFVYILYGLTCEAERGGFRLLPTSRRDWLGYGFRTLEMLIAASYLLITWGRRAHGMPVPGLNIASALLPIGMFVLFLSCLIFRRSDWALIGTGWWFLFLTVLIGLPALFPAMVVN